MYMHTHTHIHKFTYSARVYGSGRRGKAVAATADSGVQSGRRRASAAGGGRSYMNATARFAKKSENPSKRGKWSWRLPKLSSVLLLRTKEGRQEVSEYWGKVTEDLVGNEKFSKVSSLHNSLCSVTVEKVAVRS